MANPKKIPKSLLMQREMIALEMSLDMYTQVEIASAIGISQSAVCAMIKRVLARELPKVQQKFADAKALQYEELIRLKQWCAAGYRKSQMPQMRITTNEQGDQVTVSHNRDGDPRWIDRIIVIEAALRAMLGLDVLAATQDPMASVAHIAREMAESAKLDAEERAADGAAAHPGGAGGPDTGGAAGVQDGPQPVQSDDPMSSPVLEAPA